MEISMNKIKEQHEMERLAREAVKVYGITQALDNAILESRGVDPAEVAGAFDAMADIARGLAADLAALAEGQGNG